MPAQLDQMRELVRRDELIELCKVAAKYQGKYTTHMRSEGNH
jgi:hypothetical protein